MREPLFPCPDCQAGLVQRMMMPSYKLDFRFMGRLWTATVPQVPILMCDECGEELHDNSTFEAVERALEATRALIRCAFFGGKNELDPNVQGPQSLSSQP